MVLDVNDPWFLTSSPNRAPHTRPETHIKTRSDTCSNNVYFIKQSIKFLGFGYKHLESQFGEEAGGETVLCSSCLYLRPQHSNAARHCIF